MVKGCLQSHTPFIPVPYTFLTIPYTSIRFHSLPYASIQPILLLGISWPPSPNLEIATKSKADCNRKVGTSPVLFSSPVSVIARTRDTLDHLV